MSGFVATAGETSFSASVKRAVQEAEASIAPMWPLNRWIAVNPWWGSRHLPVEHVDRLSMERAGYSLLMPPAYYRSCWQSGRISRQDLAYAIRESASGLTPADLISALEGEKVIGRAVVPSSMDVETSAGDRVVNVHILEQVSRVSGLYFDKRQSHWLEHDEDHGLLSAWLADLRYDYGLDQRVNLKGARKFLSGLSADADKIMTEAFKALELSEIEFEALVQKLLWSLNGWASWCQGVAWRSQQEGRESNLMRELGAVLLAWELCALQLKNTEQRLQWQADWQRYRRQSSVNTPQQIWWLWHRAFEAGYQRTLFKKLTAGGSGKPEAKSSIPEVQMAFCIDVRSEPVRRHLESANPGIQTVGFAGFFGLPISFRPLAPGKELPAVPGLLAPTYRYAETTGSGSDDRKLSRSRDQRELTRQSVRKAKYNSLSSFTLVETTGLAWAWKLLKDSFPNYARAKKEAATCTHGRLYHRHGGDPVTDGERAKLAEAMLRGMSLVDNFAPVIVFTGHGSHADNNPHQASLACGACGGQNGGVNARLAAELINDPEVRSRLRDTGISIPETTRAFAAEHCTVTDQITLFGLDETPESHRRRIRDLEGKLHQAGMSCRRERATSLGCNGLTDEELADSLARRTGDWSQVRAEWGLANNASIIFAKRSRTRALDLGGRAFLHDYDEHKDRDGKILEALMTAPMIVANWINLQYMGSVVAPDVLGAGNKLLHSVVGGNLGVVEGNNPDLRVGLPFQSVHDGKQWRHEPLRLTVVIEAQREPIEAVIGAQPDVARLVENQWLWLYRFDGDEIEQYRHGEWVTVQQD